MIMKRGTWIGILIVVLALIVVAGIYYSVTRERPLPTTPPTAEQPIPPKAKPATGEPIKIGAILPLRGQLALAPAISTFTRLYIPIVENTGGRECLL